MQHNLTIPGFIVGWGGKVGIIGGGNVNWAHITSAYKIYAVASYYEKAGMMLSYIVTQIKIAT